MLIRVRTLFSIFMEILPPNTIVAAPVRWAEFVVSVLQLLVAQVGQIGESRSKVIDHTGTIGEWAVLPCCCKPGGSCVVVNREACSSQVGYTANTLVGSSLLVISCRVVFGKAFVVGGFVVEFAVGISDCMEKVAFVPSEVRTL